MVLPQRKQLRRSTANSSVTINSFLHVAVVIRTAKGCSWSLRFVTARQYLLKGVSERERERERDFLMAQVLSCAVLTWK